jgi:BioD-like phosphotransacetylase family protein
MSVLLVASSEPRAGRSLIAAAIAYRLGREGKQVTLARIAGDDSDAPDAAAFAALEGIVTPGAPVEAAAAKALPGDLVLEAPSGSIRQLAEALGAKVVAVGTATSAALDVTAAASVITRVRAADVAEIARRTGVTAVLAEDALLAAPSVADIAAALHARQLAGDLRSSVDCVMIGTVASDAATPYFRNRPRTCVVTRYDKTDIQLAALQTDMACLVITGGGEPSPYLLDRVRGSRDDVAVLLAEGSTVETMRAIEPLYGASRFEGHGKLDRAVALLDAASFPLDL